MTKKLLVFTLAVAAMAAGAWFAQQGDKPVAVDANAGFQGRALTPPRKIAMPPLTLDDGSVFDQQDVTGDWSLLFFGYTNCPDICPMTMNVVRQAKKQARFDFPEVIFISVDPQRDSADMIGEYVRYFDPEFRGVTGSEEMLKALSLQTSVVYMKMPNESGDPNNYLVEHSSSLLLLNPEGKLHAFIQAPHTPGSVNTALKQLIANR